MKRLLTIVAFVFLCSVAGPAYAQQHSATLFYEPEVISYSGASDTAIENLDNKQIGVPDHWGYVPSLRLQKSAKLVFFERDARKRFKVCQWS